VIADFAPSVVHAHSLEGRFAFANAMLSQNVPLLTTAHSTHYFEHAATPKLSERHRALVVRSLGKARDVLFVSGYLEDRFKELFPAESARIRGHVLPNPIDAKRYRAGREAAEAAGADGAVGGYAGGEGDGGCGSGSGGGGTARPAFSRAEAWHQLGLPGDSRMLLFVGNLILRKAPQAFVRAVSELRADGRAVHGVLVGDGPERAATEALIQELGLDEAIMLAGQKTQDELAAYYAAADVFVLPSLQESFGLVAVEAMLVGCPVVGTPDVLPEVVPPFAGTFVRSGMSLVDAVANALDRTWDRDAIAAHALGYDWKVRIGDFERLYEAVGG